MSKRKSFSKAFKAKVAIEAMGQMKISDGEQLCQLQKEADEIAFELQSEPPFYHFDVESNRLVKHKLSDCAEKLYNNSQKCFRQLCKFHSFAPKLLAKYQTSELNHIAENFITRSHPKTLLRRITMQPS